MLCRNADSEVRNRAVSGTSSNLRQALSPIANGVPRGDDPDSAASLPSPPRGVDTSSISYCAVALRGNPMYGYGGALLLLGLGGMADFSGISMLVII